MVSDVWSITISQEEGPSLVLHSFWTFPPLLIISLPFPFVSSFALMHLFFLFYSWFWFSIPILIAVTLSPPPYILAGSSSRHLFPLFWLPWGFLNLVWSKLDIFFLSLWGQRCASSLPSPTSPPPVASLLVATLPPCANAWPTCANVGASPMLLSAGFVFFLYFIYFYLFFSFFVT